MKGAINRFAINNYRLNGPGGGNIRSVQRGTVTLAAASTPITITPVKTNDSVVKMSFLSTGTSANEKWNSLRATLTNSATVTLTAPVFDAFSGMKAEWEVVEFNNVKSKQTGSKNIADTAVNTVSITSINKDKSILFFSYTCNSTTGDIKYALASGNIADATTLNFTMGQAGNIDIAWQVIEFS